MLAKSFPGEGTKHRREERSRKKNCYCYVFFLSALDFNWPSLLFSLTNHLLSSLPSSSPLFLSPLFCRQESKGTNQQEKGKNKVKRKEQAIDGFVFPFNLQRVVRFSFFLPSFILDSICHPSVHRDSATDPRQRFDFRLTSAYAAFGARHPAANRPTSHHLVGGFWAPRK